MGPELLAHIKPPGQRPPQNRSDRRFLSKHQNQHERLSWDTRLQRIHNEIQKGIRESNELYSEHNYNITDTIYQGDDRIIKAAEVKHQAALILEKARQANEVHNITRPEYFENLHESVAFSRKISGLSLLDIEKMPYPLSDDNILSITKMFNLSIFKFLTATFQKNAFEHHGINMTRQNIVVLATQPIAQPEAKIQISHHLHPIYSRLQSFFDRYVGLTTDFSLKFSDEILYFNLLHRAMPWLPQLLANYLPARLGITPASAIKLYQERAKYSRYPTKLWGNYESSNRRKGLVGIMGIGSESAFSKKGLTAEFGSFFKYNAAIDKAAEAILQDSYRDDLDASDNNLEINNLVTRLNRYKLVLGKSLFNRQQAYNLDVHEGAISTVSVLKRYPNSLMLVLHFPDSQAHLTIDLTKNGDIYGFPAGLSPQKALTRSVMTDVLVPLLEKVQLLRPDIEPVSIKAAQPFKNIDEGLVSIPKIAYEPAIKEAKTTQRRQTLSPIAQYFAQFNQNKIPELTTRTNDFIEQKYKLILPGNLEPDMDALAEYATDFASDLSRGDLVLRRDVLATIESLIENPYGSGCSKIWAAKKDKLWHYRADKRIPLSREEAKRIRVVYSFGPDHTIVLHRILHHREFDRIFNHAQ